MPFDSKSAKKAGKKSKRGPAKKEGQTVTLTLNSVNYTANVSSNSVRITVTAAGLQALSNNTDYTL